MKVSGLSFHGSTLILFFWSLHNSWIMYSSSFIFDCLYFHPIFLPCFLPSYSVLVNPACMTWKAIWNSCALLHGMHRWKKILSNKMQAFKRNAHKSRQEALKIKSVLQSQIYDLIVNMLQRGRAYPTSSIFCESRRWCLMEEEKIGMFAK